MARRSPTHSASSNGAAQVGVRLNLDTHRWLKDWADREHRSIASVARQVLEERRELEEAV